EVMLATGRISGRPPLASHRPSYDLEAVRTERSLTRVNFRVTNSFHFRAHVAVRSIADATSVRLRYLKLIRELRRLRGRVVHLLFIAAARSTGESWANN